LFSVFLSITNERANFYKALFWGWDFEKIDWLKHYRAVTDRIIERGTRKDWDELVRFYGREKVVTSLKHELNALPWLCSGGYA